jgi:hypothetical protein
MRDMPTVNVTNPLQEKAMAVIAVARENDITSTEIEAMDDGQRSVLLETAGVEPDPTYRGSADRIIGVAAHLWMTDEERAIKDRRAAEARMAPKGECGYCDSERENGSTFFPAHKSSARCRSGGYNHCSCDTCF